MKIILIVIFTISNFCLFAQVKPTSVKIKDSGQNNSLEKQKIIATNQDSLINFTLPDNQPQATTNSITSKSNKYSLMSSYEFGLSLGVLFFGILMIILEIYLIKTKKVGEELLVRFILITLIITATLFLITAGYDNNQIAPAIGLFGTVAGYLLGKSINKNNNNEP